MKDPSSFPGAGRAFATFWDWKDDRPEDEIAARVASLTALGATTTHEMEVPVGRDDFCIVIADAALEEQEATALWSEWFHDIWEYDWEQEQDPIEFLGAGTGDHFTVLVHGRVVGFARRALQFEPKGSQQDFRRELRQLIRSLPRTGSLFAQFESGYSEISPDLENVLLYNVGSSAFSDLGLEAIVLDRTFGRPSDADLWTVRSVHSTSPLDGGWLPADAMAQWSRVEVPSSRGLDAGEYWAAMRQAIVAGRVNLNVAEPADKIGVRLVLHGHWPIQLADLVKPIVDGVLCAFASHVGTPEGAIEEIARRGRLDRADTVRLLAPTAAEFLGSQGFIRSRGTAGVIFNAPDDLVVHLDIRRAHPKAPASLSGSITAVVERELPTQAPQPLVIVEDDDDYPAGGPDPQHPCPMCGSTPAAPGDGSGRLCRECGWTWILGVTGGYYTDW